MHTTFYKRGFTFVEVVVVVGIIALMASISILGFQNYAQYQRYDQEIAAVKASLLDARSAARAAVNDEAHGVKFLGSSIVLFSGDTYVAGDPQNETVTLRSITASTALTGGVTEVVFAKLTGAPLVSGTITLTGIQYTGSTTLEITDAGVIQ